MDQFMFKAFGEYYDKDAEKALQGNINIDLLNALLNHPFFTEAFPKSTGPELFNLDYLNQAQQDSGTLHISNYDVMATLLEFTAITIGNAIKSCDSNLANTQIIIS